jgi:hypothetical protein
MSSINQPDTQPDTQPAKQPNKSLVDITIDDLADRNAVDTYLTKLSAFILKMIYEEQGRICLLPMRSQILKGDSIRVAITNIQNVMCPGIVDKSVLESRLNTVEKYLEEYCNYNKYRIGYENIQSDMIIPLRILRTIYYRHFIAPTMPLPI